MDKNRSAYKTTLENFLAFEGALTRIPTNPNSNAGGLFWDNSYFNGIDAASLFCLLCLRKPLRYIEIGSGYSTAFAARAKADFHLPTEITSIDPSPRIWIDKVCDRVIRSRLEDMDLSLFDELAEGDFLFMDGSHHCFMNSDATTFFLDVLPRVRPGVFIHMHDIYLPYDYPPESVNWYFSEQYLLGVYLLAAADKVEVVFPSAFIVHDQELNLLAGSLLMRANPRRSTALGASFWLRTREPLGAL